MNDTMTRTTTRDRDRLLDAVPLLHARVAVIICSVHKSIVSIVCVKFWMWRRRTEALVRIARAAVLRPETAVAARTVRVRVVLVAHARKEVNLVFAREEGRGNTVHGRVAPALCSREHAVSGDSAMLVTWVQTHLVVEPASGIEVLEEFCVCLAAPELHVGDLEVAPDCEMCQD